MKTTRNRLLALLATGTVVVACRPQLEEREWWVQRPRVIAVRSEPAEVRPGTLQRYSACLAIPEGVPESPEPRWHYCTAPKPPIEDNSVSTECWSDGALLEAGVGTAVQASPPANACSLFGPSVSGAGARPRDPDATGGYFQPMRIDYGWDEPTFHLQRISCPLAEASADIAREFARRYTANENPRLDRVTLRDGRKVLEFDAVPAGSRVALEARWAEASREAYAYFDSETQTVITRHESLRLSFFVSAGELDYGTVGRDEDEVSVSVGNTWTAPNTLGTVRLWLVLHDSRGGVDCTSFELSVVP